MNYSELISQLLMVVGLLVIFVNIVTEVTKKIYNFKSAQSLNIYVAVISIVFTMISFVAYWQINGMILTWYLIIAFVIVGFMVAYAAMFGFDKLLKYFEKVE